jgi:hypothetical protein
VELPRLQPLYEKYRDQGLEIIAVDAYRDRLRAQKLIEEKGLSYTLLENGEEDAEVVGEIFKVHSFPTSLLIDRSGRVFFSHLGFEIGDELKLEQEIRELL